MSIMRPVLLVSSHFVQPPSEVISFRDLSLACSDYFDAILIECHTPLERNVLWPWLKKYGALDFVEDLIIMGTNEGVAIRPSKPAEVIINKLWQGNLVQVIHSVRSYSAHI